VRLCLYDSYAGRSRGGELRWNREVSDSPELKWMRFRDFLIWQWESIEALSYPQMIRYIPKQCEENY
jgi:hypothetical protein